MAVSVDTVYQKVLAFANKEQRGYITPQEFNLFADQAQMEIFEQYFYDKNQFGRVPGNSYEYSDIITNLEGKIAVFERYNRGVNVNYSSSAAAHENFAPRTKQTWGDTMVEEQIPDIYRIGTVRVSYSKGGVMQNSNVAERIAINEALEYAYSPLGRWTEQRPVYMEYPSSGKLRIKIYPYPHHDSSIDKVSISYIRKPLKPNWGYVVVNDKPLYNSNTSQDFELHLSEESELVYRILAFTGIAIEKPGLTQVAAGLEGAKQQQEKQ